MPHLSTQNLSPGLGAALTLQVYNALDCAVTHEVFGEIEQLLVSRPHSQLAYNFTRAMQAPALEMMLRGVLIDQFHRWNSIADLESQIEKVQLILDEFAEVVWGKGLNPNSKPQMHEFFYQVLSLPVQHKVQMGERKPSLDREALEKLTGYFIAEPFCRCCLKLRELKKLVSVLKSEVDDDNRMRSTYSVTGTETSRWSSSRNAFGGGTNLQNLTELLRRMFIADPGWKFANVDLEQAESRALAWICYIKFGATAYLDACESGDLHTFCCKLIWPNLPWTGNPAADKKIAEGTFYRNFSYRDMSKRGGHGTNYYGTPPTMAKHLKVPIKLMEDFQYAYFTKFPEIRDYHRWVAEQLQLSSYIETPLGTGREFFGRSWDDSTLREAIAHSPQHMVGVLLNLALWRVWKHLGLRVQILLQVHDSIVFQYREEDEAVLEEAKRFMVTPLHHGERTLIIPSEIKVGWNWQDPTKISSYRETLDPYQFNPDGLRTFKGSDARTRQEWPQSNRLDRWVS